MLDALNTDIESKVLQFILLMYTYIVVQLVADIQYSNIE